MMRIALGVSVIRIDFGLAVMRIDLGLCDGSRLGVRNEGRIGSVW